MDNTGKILIGVTSSALFDVRNREKGGLTPGAAFPLVRRLLGMNRFFPTGEPAVEVVLLSRNDPDTGLGVLNSIGDHGLAIGRALFTSGRNPFRYARALDCSLFLSSNIDDVRQALASGVPAGRVCPSAYRDDPADDELRIGFDFDGVLAGDASEQVYQTRGLEAFQEMERNCAHQPLDQGPLARFCVQLSGLQHRLARSRASRAGGQPTIRTAIVTSRGAPAHTRVLTTLRSWGIAVDEAFFLAGLPKFPVLSELRPHIFFDDQLQHLTEATDIAPCAHVPFGITDRFETADRVH